MKNAAILFALSAAVLAALGVAPAVGQQSISSKVSVHPVDNIVRDDQGRVDYMVQLTSETPPAYAARLNTQSRFPAFHKPQVVNAVADFENYYGFQAHSVTSWTVPGFAAFMTEDQANRLRADPRVKAIGPNRRAEFSIAAVNDTAAVWRDSIHIPGETKSWGLVAVNPSATPSTGAALVYVLDTGIGWHEDLNVVEWANPTSPADNCGTRLGAECKTNLPPDMIGCYEHSTSVAGVIGAMANSMGTLGVNPGVRIVSVVAEDTQDTSTAHCEQIAVGGVYVVTSQSVAHALDWIASDIASGQNPYTSVVNLSLNFGQGGMAMVNPYIQALTQTAGHGAIVVESAGNDYDSACAYSYDPGGGVAVSNDGVVVVGAINNHGQAVIPYVAGDSPNVAPFVGFWKDARQFGYEAGSNYGPCVDLWAPGDGIYMPVANPATLSNQQPGVQYSTYGMGSGTSFAAPHVAGLASVLIEQQHLTSPSAVETAIRSRLLTLGSSDTCNGGACNIAIKMPQLNNTPPSPASQPYGELVLGTNNVNLARTTNVNGYPFNSSTNNYDGELPHAFNAYYDMSVSFHANANCTVTRASGANTANVVNNQSSYSGVQAWNEGSGGASSTWTVSSTCFPSGTTITSYTPNPVPLVSHTGTFYPGQTGAAYTLTVTNSGYATRGSVTFTDMLPAGLTATSIAGTGWTSCTTSPSVKCSRTDVLATGAAYPPLTLTVNVAANATGTLLNSATISGGGLVTAVSTTDSTIIGTPDLKMTKSHTGNFVQGQTGATYSLVVSNVGSAASIGTVTVSDALPAGLTATAIGGSGWGSCTTSPTIQCSRSDALAAGASYPALTVTVNVASSAAASVTNTATVSGGGDTNNANNTASDPTTITQLPDLKIVKTHAGNFSQGQTGATYSLAVSNVGSAASSGTVTVSDALPAGLTATAIGGSGWGSCTTSPTIQCSRSDALAAGASYPALTVTVNVASSAAASVTNTATVSGGGDTNNANNTASDPTTITQLPDLKIVKTHAGNFSQGQTGATYSLVVSNVGSAASSGTVTVSDALPAGLTATAIGGSGWGSCTTSPTIQCSRSDALAAGASYPALTVTVNVANNAAGSVTNAALVSGGGDVSPGNNTASDVTTILAQPDLTIASAHNSFYQGEGVTTIPPYFGATYTLTVRNTGSAASTGQVTVTDTLPTGLTPIIVSGSGWTCSYSPLTCRRSDALAAGASYPTITAKIDVAYNAPLSVTNVVNVSGGGDITSGDNTFNDVTAITAEPHPQIAVSHSGTFTQAQTNAQYTLTVSNNGSAATSGTVAVRESPSTGLGLVALSGTGWTCAQASCSRTDALAVGSSYPPITATVNVTPDAPSSVLNTATVTDTINNSLSFSATATDTATVNPIVFGASPDLAVWIDSSEFARVEDVSTVSFSNVHLTVNVNFATEGLVFTAPAACTLTGTGQIGSSATFDCSVGALTSGASASFGIQCDNPNGSPVSGATPTPGTIAVSLVTPTTPSDSNSGNNAASAAMQCATSSF